MNIAREYNVGGVAMCKVTVIIPIYNDEKYLEQCISSIQNQTLRDIQIICVDDGSTDSSPAILQECKKREPRMLVLTQTNQGAGAARNLGMQHAEGEYISFLDSDDIFDPYMLELMSEKAEREKLDVVVCRADRFHSVNGTYESIDWSIHEDLLPDYSPFSSLDIKHNFFEAFVWWPWDKLFRRGFLEQTGLHYQPLRTTNDLFFVAAAMLSARRIGILNQIFVHQRIGILSSLSATREKSWDNFYKALIKLRMFMKDKGIYERFEQDFINYCLNFSMWHLDTIQGKSFMLLYEALRKKWIQDFDILGEKKAEYFYNRDNLKKIYHILKTSPEDFLFERIHRLEERCSQWRVKANHLETECNAMKKENISLKKDLETIQFDKNSMENSLSFRLGRALTYPGRIVRDRLKT